MHAASLFRNGYALMLGGRSGTGKTGVARMAPPDCSLLTDDISCVVRRSDYFSAVGTPFYCGLGRPGKNLKGPIKSLYLLTPGLENKVETMEKAIAVRRLLRNILFFTQDFEFVKSVFETACEFVDRVPAKQLTFVSGTSIWNLIE